MCHYHNLNIYASELIDDLEGDASREEEEYKYGSYDTLFRIKLATRDIDSFWGQIETFSPLFALLGTPQLLSSSRELVMLYICVYTVSREYNSFFAVNFPSPRRRVAFVIIRHCPVYLDCSSNMEAVYIIVFDVIMYRPIVEFRV